MEPFGRLRVVYLQEGGMQLRRDLEQDKRDGERVAALRAQAPNTVKLEGLLWALAESQGTSPRYEDVALVASSVTGWANQGHEADAFLTLAAVEAALKAAGVRL